MAGNFRSEAESGLGVRIENAVIALTRRLSIGQQGPDIVDVTAVEAAAADPDDGSKPGFFRSDRFALAYRPAAGSFTPGQSG